METCVGEAFKVECRKRFVLDLRSDCGAMAMDGVGPSCDIRRNGVALSGR